MSNKHTDNNYSNDDSEFGYNTSAEHTLEMHNNNKPFECNDCDSSFGFEETLKDHVRIVHNNHMPFKCNDCDYSFGFEGTLKTHTRVVHHGNESFDCE